MSQIDDYSLIYSADEDIAKLSEQALQADSSQRVKNLQLVEKAKLFLLSGNLKRAKRTLEKIEDRNGRILKLKQRYLATIHFIEGNYQEVMDILNQQAFLFDSSRQKVCGLRLATQIITGDMRGIDTHLAYCKANQADSSRTDYVWAEFLINIRKKDFFTLSGNHLFDIGRYIASVELTKIWLKMALYLNHISKVLENLTFLPLEFYSSKKIRELIGFLYYRKGDDNKSLEFIEDIDSSNAENIRGNITLRQKKFELAFGHFQLALRRKKNSINAIERSITLAWLLGKWKRGLELTSQVGTTLENLDKKNTLKAAFYTQMGDFTNALIQLKGIVRKFAGAQPHEVNQLYSFNSLMLEDQLLARRHTDLACRKEDGLYCWLLLQLSNWQNFGEVIKSDATQFYEPELEVDELKKPVDTDPLKEEIFIDQRDVEELDESELMKQSTELGPKLFSL